MKFGLLVLSFLLLTCAVAVAQEPGPPAGRRAAFMQACGQDVQTYCATAQSRDERRACIRANRDKFSDPCKAFIANHFTHHEGSQIQGQGQ